MFPGLKISPKCVCGSQRSQTLNWIRGREGKEEEGRGKERKERRGGEGKGEEREEKGEKGRSPKLKVWSRPCR